MLGYFLAGLWVRDVTRYFLLALPSAVLAILLGGMLNRKLRGDTFVRYVYAGLVLVGACLIDAGGPRLEQVGAVDHPPAHPQRHEGFENSPAQRQPERTHAEDGEQEPERLRLRIQRS